MTEISAKDRQILTLRAARMSTATIAGLVGWSEARVYNRLNTLGVTTASAATALLAGPPPLDLSGLAAFGEARMTTLLAFAAQLSPPAPQAPEDPVEAPPPAPPRSAPPSLSTCAPISSPKPTCRATRTTNMPAVSPRSRPEPMRSPPSPSSSFRPLSRSPGRVVGIKPVSARIATWAGHFRRARWPLEEVADLFDVAEDDLALVLGEAA